MGKQNVIQYPGETISILDIVGQWFGMSHKWTCIHCKKWGIARFEAPRSASYFASFQWLNIYTSTSPILSCVIKNIVVAEIHLRVLLKTTYCSFHLRLGCFLLLQLFLNLGDMFISDCFFLQILWSHTCDLYPNPSLLVWAPLSWHTTCQSSSTAYRQLDNNQLNYSESQKSVLRQETVCTSCWLWDNAPNVVILGASVCPGVGCYNLVLCKPHSQKYFSIVIYASPLICGAYL